MMRLFLYLCIISLVACNSAPSNSFRLEGFVEDAEDSEDIILSYYILKDNEWQEITDTTKVINGKFLFEGTIDEWTAAELCFDYSYVAISVRMYLEPTTMRLRINKSQPYAYQLSGTKVEKENIELRKELEPDEKIYYEGLERMDDILKQIQIALNDNKIPVLDSLINLLQYVKEHTETIRLKMSETQLDFILRHEMYRIVPDLLYLLTKSESFPIDTIKCIYNNLPKQSKTGLMGKLAFKQIEYLEKENDTAKVTLIGSPTPDFSRKDCFGKAIRLSDFKNKKIVLLDFWASWCAPCIKEIPKIKNLYDKYSEKGLMIISISSDKDSDSWRNAINKYQLGAWPQILSVEDNNNSVFNTDDIFFMYNVEAIPHFMLIDKQGQIIADWDYLGEEQLSEIDRILK